MMSLSRTILAASLAVLMGAPICCCAYETKAETGKQQPSCCHATQPLQDGQQKPEEHICACRSKDPRESAKELKVPGNQGVEFTPPAVESFEPVVLEPATPLITRNPQTGCDPPTRLRLAHLSRWLN